jgi:hypothetical protein
VDEEAELRRKAQTPMSIEEIRALGAKIETLTGDHLQVQCCRYGAVCLAQCEPT